MFTVTDPFGCRDPFAPDDAGFDDVQPQSWAVEMRDSLAEARIELRDNQSPTPAPTSAPLYTVEVGGGLTLTIIRAPWRQRDSYQLYCCEAENWALTGLFGLYTDALAEVATWRRYLAAGGSLSAWQAEHPDGIQRGAR